MSIIGSAANQVFGRFVAAGCGVGMIFSETFNGIKTVTGIGASVLSVCTGGKVDGINRWAVMTDRSVYSLSDFYRVGIVIVDLSSDLEDESKGLFREIVQDKIIMKCYSLKTYTTFSGEEKSIKKLNRLAFLSQATLGVVARVVDFVIGVFAAIASVFVAAARMAFAVCGSKKLNGVAGSVNTFAYRNLTLLGAIDDLCKGVRGFINPSQKGLGWTRVSI